jgi:hypothetical protein
MDTAVSLAGIAVALSLVGLATASLLPLFTLSAVIGG